MARGKKTGGRKKGTPNRRTEQLRRLIVPINDDDRAIIDRVIAGARNGDHVSLQIYFRYLRPAPPRSETFTSPIDYVKPETVEAARERILELGERLAKGEVGVENHDALVGGLKAFLSDKAADQQRELDRLKEDLGRGQ
jgi:hypothetical protein